MIRVNKKFVIKKAGIAFAVGFFALWGCSQSKQKISDIKQQKKIETGVTQINGLKSLTLQDNEGHLVIKFEAEKALSPNIFRLSDPQRIVVDLVNTRNLLNDSVINSTSNVVKEVTVNEFNDNNNILSRVVIVLNKNVEYEAHALSNGLALKILAPNVRNTLPQENDNLSIAEFSLMENLDQDNVQTPKTNQTGFQSKITSANKNQLIKILSRPQIDGTEIELIFSEPIKEYHDFSLNGPNRIVFDLQDVENVLTEGKTVSVLSDEVSQIRLGEAKNKTRAVIDLSGIDHATYKVSKSDNRLKVYIPSKSIPDVVPTMNKTTDIASRDKIKNESKVKQDKTKDAAVSMVALDNTATSTQVNSSELKENSFLDLAAMNSNVVSSPNNATKVNNAKALASVKRQESKTTTINHLNSLQLEKDKEQALLKLVLDNNVDYEILNSQPDVLKIELNNVAYKKSKLKKLLKQQNYSGTAINDLSIKKADKNNILVELSLKDQAIFEVGEEEKGLLVRVSPKKQEQEVVADNRLLLTNNETLALNNVEDTNSLSKSNARPQESKTVARATRPVITDNQNQVETLANDLIEVQGLEDDVKNTFPQERVIENPLGLEVQDSNKIKNYAYVKEEFMSDTIADGEPLSQMGSILSGAVEGKKFTGRRISLDFKDAEVKSIFKLIAEISQFNIIISDDVTGRITIRLDEVPWDQAFAIILQTRGLWFEKYGNIIRVAPAANLQREKEAAADAEKAAKAVKPLDILFKPVSFAQAGTLEKQVKSVLSDRGTVDIDSRTNTLIIKDIREHLDKAKRMIDILDTQTPQVTIEARIVEATTTFTRSFGINWSGSASFTSATGNPTGLFFPNSIGIPNFALNFPVEAGAINTQANLRLGSINNILDLDLAIALGEQEGNFKLISSPKVTVLDNSSATISAGTQIPYQTQSDNLGTNVNFQTANTSLTVTPHITNDGSILMSISATRDEPNFSASVDGNPTIDQRTASTEVLVKSGNTTVIGGIYSTSSGGNQSRLPVLHRIPIIGALFKNYNKTVRRSELLIFVTPRIVGDERKAIRNVRE
ncbi:MAG TPA: type IV pilus secretin PilQ [Oligoflexia bacterium]|nr:type IV pilus secretin PilQ [Oligoflexia bacterium]HMR25733.1 type IV pilus secretin PilQ [Oligoflexia bacterium]